MLEKAFFKLRARDDVSDAEETVLRDAVSCIKTIASDQTLVREGEDQTASHILLDGLMCRYKDLESGARQITELHVAGDFVDLHSFPLKRLDHNVMTLTPCEVAFVPHAGLKAITEHHPHLTRLLWFSTTLDAAIHREWSFRLGGGRQRSASPTFSANC